MKTVSLKINDEIFVETESILSKLKKPRNRYINEALDFYNRKQKRAMLEKMLEKESKIVAEDSKEVIHEFEAIEFHD